MKIELDVTNACRLFGPCWAASKLLLTVTKLVTNACRLFGPCWAKCFAQRQMKSRKVTNACRLFGPCWAD